MKAPKVNPLKSRTVLTGLLSIIGAIVAGGSGDMSTPDALQLGVTGLLAIFMQRAIVKSGGNPPE